jgi:hypothetical protein
VSTLHWLERQRHRVLRHEGLAALLIVAGAAALLLALGVLGARLGAYRRAPQLVLVGWAALGLLGAGAAALVVRRVRRFTAGVLAAELERGAGLRAGALSGLTGAPHGSASLAALADRQMAGWLGEHGAPVAAAAVARRRRALGGGLVLAAVGMVGLVAAGPRSGSEFWSPLDVLRRARAPVVLSVDRVTVRRGDSVVATVRALGRTAALLHVRAAGEPWHETPLALDPSGTASVILGPLDSDRHLFATSGGRGSDTAVVRVSPAPFLADLSLLARYPAYLSRPDEPLPVGADTLLLPQGTVVEARGRTSVPIARAAWVAGERRATLAPRGTTFSGGLTVHASGTWTLEVMGEDGLPLDGPAPTLVIRAVPDSAPLVSVPVPGADTTAPTSLRQPLVVDVRDDIGVARVEVISRRVSRLGIAGAPVTETIPLPQGGVERAVLQWQLDLNARGFLPGDTAFYRVRAWDGAPAPHQAETREYALRLPSLAELREAVRAEARALAGAADSVARGQRELERRTGDLARERERATAPDGRTPTGEEQLGFRAAERAGELTAEQRRLLDRADQLRQRLDDLSKTAWDAGLTDPAWQQQLADLRELLERAVTPELEETLRQLEEAMRRLDAAAVREALEKLATQQEQLRRELDRSRTLFERAALEGEMTSLAQDAAELAERQREWNRAAARAVDSATARAERALGAQADSLAKALERIEKEIGDSSTPGLRPGSDSAQGSRAGSDSLSPGGRPESEPAGAQRAQRASQRMGQAAQAASQGQRGQAAESGKEASEELDPIAESLRRQRDQLREQWRQEVTDALGRALVETAQLARRQEDVQERLQRGESGPDVRAAQAATRDGVDRVLDRLQQAAGKNALVPPALGAALGYARNKMDGALDALQQGTPNARAAGGEAGEALDGLNALAAQLVRAQSDVQGAESGSGLQEAIERMAQLAQQQGAMAGQSGAMLPLMSSGGQSLLQELRALAAQQRQLQAELQRLQAQGDLAGAGRLADEAGEIARRLEAGVLDRNIVERQERLFRRLLDQGRTLRGEEEDEKKERTSETGDQSHVLVPLGRPPVDRGPRFRYPTWEELQHLSPADRRLILDYFRRLNEKK